MMIVGQMDVCHSLLVGRLMFSFQTEESSVASMLTSLVAVAFNLKLSWTLLSRHVLPYQVQDHVSHLLSFEYKHAVAEWISRCGGKMLALRFWRCVACLFIYWSVFNMEREGNLAKNQSKWARQMSHKNLSSKLPRPMKLNEIVGTKKLFLSFKTRRNHDWVAFHGRQVKSLQSIKRVEF